MEPEDFLASLEQPEPPPGLDAWLQALWHARKGDWDRAHRIVQSLSDRKAARIHAWLHRVEGDEWNSRYWHRQAGTEFPGHLTEEQEWERLVRMALATAGSGRLPDDRA